MPKPKTPQRIKSLAELKRRALKKGGASYYILLNYGLRSSKGIERVGARWEVWNLCDNSVDRFTDKQLAESNTGKAIKAGACFLD